MVGRRAPKQRARLRLIATLSTVISGGFGGAGLCLAASTPGGVTSQGIGTAVPALKLCTASDQPSAEVRSRAGYAQFQVSVIDAAGRPIIHLKEPDFLFSNYQPAPQFVYFNEYAAGPARSLLVLIDASGSMKEKLPKVENSFAAFLETVNPCDEVETVAFSSKGGVRILDSFTTDRAITAQSIAGIEPYGETQLYDAIEQSIRTEAGFAHYPARDVIVVTDGVDTSSTTSKDDVIAEAREGGVPIYAIGIGDPTTAKRPFNIKFGPFRLRGPVAAEWVDADTLEAITGAAAGRSFFVQPISKDGGASLVNALASISAILGSGYTIGAIMPPAGVAPIVTIANRPSAIVHVSTVAPMSQPVR